MPSYQEIEMAVKVLQDKIDFVMTTCRMKAALSSGLAGPDGLPLPPKIFDGSLKELYYLSKQLPVELDSDKDEKDNG